MSHCNDCRAEAVRTRIEQADSYLNDAALPSYREVVETLNQLVLDPRLEGYESEALARAELLCDRLREVLA